VEPSAAILVLPTTTAGEQGPVASWISTAGWAVAARRLLGDAWIVTPAGILDVDAVRAAAARSELSSDAASKWRRRVPAVVKTAVRDVRDWRRARAFQVDPNGPWRDRRVEFVWQRHELLHTAGLELAQQLGVPSVLFVPAPLLWQAQQWGVRRPGWGRFLERYGEQRSLQRADVVACGSDVVAGEVARLGVDDARIVITPTGVDLDRFSDTARGSVVRSRLGLDGRFVVGWVGSFRRFHAIEQAIDAVADVDGAALLLVGDGPERPRVEAAARERGVHAVFTGTVSQASLPDHLGAMDAALVLASADRPFHYSPLKLAEYLAASRPVIAPRVGQLASRLHDGRDALLVPPGDAGALAAALRRLRDDPALRGQLALSARATAEASFSWDHAVERVLDRLPTRPRTRELP
jgi:glycosyltransferase involved in cell wall biosynthesis